MERSGCLGKQPLPECFLLLAVKQLFLGDGATFLAVAEPIRPAIAMWPVPCYSMPALRSFFIKRFRAAASFFFFCTLGFS